MRSGFALRGVLKTPNLRSNFRMDHPLRRSQIASKQRNSQCLKQAMNTHLSLSTGG